MKALQTTIVLALTLLSTACSNPELTRPQEGALIGGAAGAGTGAIVGNQFDGKSGEGALIGAGAGALTGAATGAIVDEAKKRNYEETIAEQQEIIRRQEEEIRRQDREIEDLKRQQYHNESLRRFDKR